MPSLRTSATGNSEIGTCLIYGLGVIFPATVAPQSCCRFMAVRGRWEANAGKRIL